LTTLYLHPIFLTFWPFNFYTLYFLKDIKKPSSSLSWVFLLDKLKHVTA
jgi:hypothetical protein